MINRNSKLMTARFARNAPRVHAIIDLLTLRFGSYGWRSGALARRGERICASAKTVPSVLGVTSAFA
jgi:hypothetical protein